MGIRQMKLWQTVANKPGFRHFTLRIGIFCCIMSLCVFSNGFDMTGYSSIQAMDGFQQRFGSSCNPITGVCTLDSSHLSMLNSIPLIGYGLGVLLSAWVSERFGRRVSFVCLNAVCIIGVGITYSAREFAQVLIGRFLVQGYVGMENNLIPMYQSEIVPAAVRGGVVGSYICFKLVGGCIMAIMSNRTRTFAGDASWKIPIVVMFAVPSLCLLLAYFIPESPRWLLRKDNREGALRVLEKLNDGNENADVQLELYYLQQSLGQSDTGSWSNLFKGTNLPRTLVAILTNFFGFASGEQFAYVYMTVWLKQNIPSVDPFLFNIYNQITGILGTLVFVFFVDRVGRRRFWVIGGPTAMSAMIVMGILGCIPNPSKAVNTGIAAMFPIYSFFYVGSYSLLPALLTSEIASLRLRDKTVMMGWSSQNITNFVFAYTLPYLVGPSAPSANLGAKVGFIYGAIGLLGALWGYFFIPELKDRSLEEINEMLKLRVPARKSRKWRPSVNSIAGKLTQLEDNNGAHEKEDFELGEVEQVEKA